MNNFYLRCYTTTGLVDVYFNTDFNSKFKFEISCSWQVLLNGFLYNLVYGVNLESY
jgi:hypothetical protein